MRSFWVGLLSCFFGVATATNLQGIIVEPEGASWTHGIVPYVIEDAISVAKHKEILDAMALWEAGTVVRFVAVTPENRAYYPDYVVFQPSAGKRCASSVGRQGGMQVLRLASRCNTMLIAHELGHLLGLWHEQARLDRDLYVEVMWKNIRTDHYHNFYQRVNDGQNQGPYDFDSIMHYSEDAFTKNGEPTLVPRIKGVQIGQRTHLSAGDITSVNALYAKNK
ncbi:MAG: M12 family metallopeptidase [Gammaproteobacteria bacterium]|nr:M12 family metallopeptidase [Gammaproteobacteria bacterium]